jgi:hypothetical protein
VFDDMPGWHHRNEGPHISILPLPGVEQPPLRLAG